MKWVEDIPMKYAKGGKIVEFFFEFIISIYSKLLMDNGPRFKVNKFK